MRATGPLPLQCGVASDIEYYDKLIDGYSGFAEVFMIILHLARRAKRA